MSSGAKYHLRNSSGSTEAQSTGLKRKRESSPTLKAATPPNDKNNFSPFGGALENCRNWANISQDQNSMIGSPGEGKAEEPYCDSPSEDETVRVTPSSTRCKGKRLWTKEQKYKLVCEWKNCSHVSDDVYSYVRHVSNHIPDLSIEMSEENREAYMCLWEECEFETDDSKEIVRHVNYHSYHSKLLYIGDLLMKELNLMKCSFSPEGRNLLPDLLEEFLCCWADCDRSFNNAQMFFYHVESHVQCNPRGRVVKGGVPCRWRGCKGVYPQVYRLSEHVKTHTQEKVIGCPTCGTLFGSRAKFLDHCNRQIPENTKGYQCTHCSKYYSTERLLRSHMRSHVNHYKCTFCDMTCPSPTALGQHIRFRHLDIRPFQCQYCEFRAKTQQVLRVHVNTHYDENLYRCSAEDCDYSCRSSKGINKHFAKVHEGITKPSYSCHICDRRFQRGAYLTSHLFKKHNLHWPSGHSRFRYKLEDDGIHRLQTVRYESLEVTQEMLREKSDEEPQVHLEKTYNLRRLPSRTQYPSAEFEVSEESDDLREEPGEAPKKILITIEELDETGNVIKSHVMETEEVPVTSLDAALVEDLE